jgi:hypothetical protein
MPTTEVFSTIRVPQEVRRQLKRYAAQLDIPMYVILQIWLAGVPTNSPLPPVALAPHAPHAPTAHASGLAGELPDA